MAIRQWARVRRGNRRPASGRRGRLPAATAEPHSSCRRRYPSHEPPRSFRPRATRSRPDRRRDPARSRRVGSVPGDPRRFALAAARRRGAHSPQAPLACRRRRGVAVDADPWRLTDVHENPTRLSHRSRPRRRGGERPKQTPGRTSISPGNRPKALRRGARQVSLGRSLAARSSTCGRTTAASPARRRLAAAASRRIQRPARPGPRRRRPASGRGRTSPTARRFVALRRPRRAMSRRCSSIESSPYVP